MIAPSELIINPDGSCFHLHLKPEQLADNVDIVGELFRFQMQVKATAIGINDKFGRCDHLILGL